MKSLLPPTEDDHLHHLRGRKPIGNGAASPIRGLAAGLLSMILGAGQQASGQAIPVDLPELKLSTYGIVRTMALQMDGKILVGGEFSSVNDIPRKNLARLNPDGTLDLSWAPALDGPCYQVIADDQHVYLAGDFSTIDGEAFRDFGRVSVFDGSVDVQMTRDIFDFPIDLAPFEQFNNQNPFDLDGYRNNRQHVLEFIPDGAGAYDHGPVEEAFPPVTEAPLGISNSDDAFEQVILTKGAFPFYGTPYTSFWVNSNGTINFTAPSADHTETLAEHFSRRQIALLWQDLDPSRGLGNPFGTINVHEMDDRVVIRFRAVSEFFPDPLTDNFNDAVAELFFDGRIRLSYPRADLTEAIVGISPGGLVYNPATNFPTDFSELRHHRQAGALAQNETHVFVGSNNGHVRKINKANGQIDPTWTPQQGAAAVEVLLPVGDIIFAGYGTGGIRRIPANGTGAADPGFDSLPDLTAGDLAHESGALVVVPGLYSDDPDGGLHPVKIDAQTGIRDSNWEISVEAPTNADNYYPVALRSIAIHDGYVYLGGSFSEIQGGGSVNRGSSVGRVLFAGVGAVDTDWKSGIDDGGGNQFEPFPVFSLLASDHGLLIGGGIGTMFGKSRMGMSLVDSGTGVLDEQFGVQIQRSGNASVNALARQRDGKLLVGGDFLFVNGVERQHLARLNADGSLDQSWKSNCSKPVTHLALGGDHLFAGLERWDALKRIKLATGAQTTAAVLLADGPDGVAIGSLVANDRFAYFTHGGVYPDPSVKLSVSGDAFSGWQPASTSSSPTNQILATDGDSLYEVFNDFGEFGYNFLGRSIRRLNQDGDGGVAWTVPIDGTGELGSQVTGMALDSEYLYICGDFTTVSGNAVFDGLCRLRKSDGAVDLTWRPVIGSQGRPTQVETAKEGVWITRGSRLDFVNGISGAVSEGAIDAAVNGILSAREGLYVGGAFSEVNSTSVSKLALLSIPEAPVVGIDQTNGKILVTKGNGNGGEVPFFRVSGITGGTLTRSNGQLVLEGDYLTFAEGEAGLVWTPDAGGSGTPGFEVRAALSQDPATLGTTSTAVNPAAGSLLPLILFEDTEVSGLEDEGSIAVKVRYTGTSPASVKISLAAGTAVPVTFTPDPTGDYFDPGTQTLNFTGPQTKSLLVPLWDDSIVEPDEVFFAELSNATGAVIGGPGRTRVLLIENDVFGNSVPGEMRLPAPMLPAPASGSLAVHLSGDDNKGQWRLVGEVDWRNSSGDPGGAPATGLSAGNYQIEFQPIDGFVAPPVLNVPMVGSETVIRTGSYANRSLFQPGTGMLDVLVEPNDVATDIDVSKRGQWKRRGDTVWRNSGDRLAVSAGLQVVQFKAVDGRETPPDRTVSVRQGQSNGTSGIYLIRSSILNARQTESLPLSAPGQHEAAMAKAPYCFNGQIATELGFGSGVVTQEHTVLTAAHVLFDDIALAQAKRVTWFFQRHKGENEPPGQIPRGWYRFEGYASQRAIDVADPALGPGIGSIDSQNLDVAVMYFLEPAGRGGYGGYQVSESTANKWLLGNRGKFLAGYPVTGIEESKRGRLHATTITNDRYSLERDFVLSTQDIESRPGNSGGPVYAWDEINNGFFPVAIYLGGARDTKVRAINNRVVSLMNQAENAGRAGGNGTGGGATYTSVGFTEDDLPRGFVTVEISGRPDGRWRLVDAGGTALSDFIPSSSLVPITPGDVYFELEDLPGLPATRRQLVTVYNGQITTMTAAYPETFDSWVQTELIDHDVTGLTGPLDDSDADGVGNLLEYAFGLNPRLSDPMPLDPDSGVKGLPLIRMSGEGPNARIRVEYIRRQATSAPGLTYTVEFGTTPAGPWVASTLPGTSTRLDPIWEHVVVEANETVNSQPRYFARVRVTPP